MKKFKKSILASDKEIKYFDAFNVINLMLFFGTLALFIFALIFSTAILIGSDKTIQYVMPVVKMGLGIVLVFLPMIINLIFKVSFPKAITSLYYLFLFLSLYLGSYLNLYASYPIYNKFIHIFSAITISFFAMFFVKKINENMNSNMIFIFVLVFAFACGAFWEIYEFIVDGILGLDLQLARDAIGRFALYDTLLDLVCDLFGSIIGGFICAISARYYSGYIKYFSLAKKVKIEDENSISQIEE